MFRNCLEYVYLVLRIIFKGIQYIHANLSHHKNGTQR